MPLFAKSSGVRVLLVDNYSSFTYNLVHYLAEVTGEMPQVILNSEAIPTDLHAFDCVVLSPGPGTPLKASDMGSSRILLENGILPVLGICLGHQGIGHRAGAQIRQSAQPLHGRRSTITHNGNPLFAKIPCNFEAVRYHSLELVSPLPDKIECIAKSEDGTVMAIAHKSLPQWGVQFHPESIQTEYGKELLSNFCALSLIRASQSGRNGSSPRERTQSPKLPDQRWTLHCHSVGHQCPADALFQTLFGKSKHSFWLDGQSSPRGISYMGDGESPDAHILQYSQSGATLTILSAGTVERVHCTSVFEYLAERFGERYLCTANASNSGFRGGYVGTFGYELGRETKHQSEFPDAQWLWVDRFVAYDHQSETATLKMLVCPESPDSAERAESWFQEVEARVNAAPDLRQTSTRAGGDGIPFSIVPRDEKANYCGKIAECMEAIRLGESYELCLTTQLSGKVDVDPFQLFLDTRKNNPAPYAAFLKSPGFSIVSASPERFMRIDADGLVQSKPIKGTARRGKTALEDKKLASQLAASEKERAENLMIVDLVRNDLGRSCELGSVVVPSFAEVESFSTVHQLVSTIEGQLRPGVPPLHCVRDAFPAGSMTGAPKIRSMQILEKLETGARGIYSGCLGYLGVDGAVELSVVIRTIVVTGESLSLGVGGAITVLSDVEAEFEEILLKASAGIESIRRVATFDG